jgi:hypothetical protein
MRQCTRLQTHSDPPGDEDGDGEAGGIVAGELVVSGGDAAPVLEAAEGPLDQVAAPVGDGVEGVAALAGRVVGDDRQGTTVDQPAAQRIAVIGGVGDAEPGGWQGGEQRRGGRGVAGLSGGQREGERPAEAVDDGVDLGRPTAA